MRRAGQGRGSDSVVQQVSGTLDLQFDGSQVLNAESPLPSQGVPCSSRLS
jgi:hypothetical protein